MILTLTLIITPNLRQRLHRQAQIQRQVLLVGRRSGAAFRVEEPNDRESPLEAMGERPEEAMGAAKELRTERPPGTGGET